MKTNSRPNKLRRMLVVTGSAALLSVARGRAEEAETPEYNNWLTLGGGGTFITGDTAQFKTRQQIPDQPFGGIEDFHWEQNLGKKGMFQMNGRGIYDNHDYSVDVGFLHPDIGFVRAGHKQFRTWYDGSGGFFPSGSTNWFSLYDEEMAVDRGETWIEAGLTLPDWPVITLRVSHEFRDGLKDSSVWGDASVASAPGVWPASTPTAPTTRNFVPAFLDINEKRDTVALDVKHTLGNTTFGLGGRYEHLENNDTRNIRRRPGETVGASAAIRADRFVTEREQLAADIFNVHAFTETRFNDRFRVTLGGSYTTEDTDSGGSRIYGDQYDPAVGPYLRSQQRDSGFFAMGGGAEVREYVGNLNFMFRPTTNLFIIPSFRVEKDEVTGLATFAPTTVNAAGGPLVTNAYQINTANRDTLEVSEALETRYVGLRNWVLFVRGEWSETCEDRDEAQGASSVSSKWTRFTQKYTGGFNWYPRARVNLGGQYYYKLSDNKWTVADDNRFRNFNTHDVNFRLTVRPARTLTLITRYDFQLSQVRHQGDGLADVEAANITSHIISESISWTPFSRMYVQLNGSYAWDGAIATGADTQAGLTNVAPNLENGYWTASVLTGFVIDDKTDFTVQYSFFKAENYENNAQWSQPYGISAEEHGITATLSRQLTKALRASVKYGYFQKQDGTSGGFNNYAAHLVYASMQYRF